MYASNKSANKGEAEALILGPGYWRTSVRVGCLIGRWEERNLHPLQRIQQLHQTAGFWNVDYFLHCELPQMRGLILSTSDSKLDQISNTFHFWIPWAALLLSPHLPTRPGGWLDFLSPVCVSSLVDTKWAKNWGRIEGETISAYWRSPEPLCFYFVINYIWDLNITRRKVKET